jgi:NADPH2:quinone reductase
VSAHAVAKAFGATVIATAGTARKLEIARSYGADHVLDYNDAAWPDKARGLTPRGRGVDIVYDPVGLVDKSTRCTAWNGRVLVVGFAAGRIEKVAMNKVLLKNISIVGIHWGQYAVQERGTVLSVWADLSRLIAEGKLRGSTFSDRDFVGLESIPEALTALGSRKTWGKVVVTVPQPGSSSSSSRSKI